MKHNTYHCNITLFFFIIIKADSLVLSMKECINTLIEEHYIVSIVPHLIALVHKEMTVSDIPNSL